MVDEQEQHLRFQADGVTKSVPLIIFVDMLGDRIYRIRYLDGDEEDLFLNDSTILESR